MTSPDLASAWIVEVLQIGREHDSHARGRRVRPFPQPIPQLVRPQDRRIRPGQRSWAARDLTPAEERFRRENNDWYNAAYPEPDIYGPDINPLAESWFKASSCELGSRVSGYLAILDAHSIAWEEVRTTDPGTILYEDRWQVVAVSATPPTGTLPR